MGSSPIARSIFQSVHRRSSPRFLSAPLLAILLAFLPSFLRGQVDPDPARPFGEGQVVLLPGTTDYLGDIPHSLEILDDTPPYHTVDGALMEEIGTMWPGAGQPVGLRSLPLGILYEGIPYPIASGDTLARLPWTGSLEYLDFPATAWWGPAASGGAVQILAPEPVEHAGDDLLLWGGSGNDLGVDDLFRSPLVSIEGNYQYPMGGGSPPNAVAISSRENWIESDSFKMESGLLASDQFLGNYWYLGFAKFDFSGPDFQSFQVKPYFQFAGSGGQTVQEVGTYLDYLFNLAGAVQSHLGAGLSDEGLRSSSLAKGFAQSTNLVDVLGMATLDVAIRVDFPGTEPALFSTVLGAQATQGSFTFLGDYDKGCLPTTGENIQQADAGLKWEFQDDWSMKAQYLFEENGQSPVNGARGQLAFESRGKMLFFQTIKFQLEEQVLQGDTGPLYFDTGCKCWIGLSGRTRLWMKGRALSDQPFYAEVGLDLGLTAQMNAFLSVANLDDQPISWPDPNSTPGRAGWAGLKGVF